MILYPIITLLILALAVGAISNHSNVDAIMGLEVKRNLDRGFVTFEESVTLYRQQNTGMVWVESCPPGFSSGDPECEWDREVDPGNDGSLDVANWESLLIPDYMQMPISRKNYTWSMDRDSSTSELYVCVSGPSEGYTKHAMAGLIDSYPSERMTISDNCNGSGLTKNQVKNYSGASLAATLKL